ncbi:fungal-specific transcription factor domain-containing protein [Aspergillus crustosus]
MDAPSGSKKPPVRTATACTECQRRKQKASKIAHLCKYAPKKAVRAANAATNNIRVSIDPEQDHWNSKSESFPDIDATTTDHDDLRSLGYLPDTQVLPDEKSTAAPFHSSVILSNEMENALHILVQHFLDNTNYHYYALYPPSFMHDYATWWSRRANGLAPTTECTCLLLRVCACSVPYLDGETRRKFEAELGESDEHLSKLYHTAARQLSSTIAPGKGGMTQLQQIFLTAQWFKTEASFVESWHTLGAAIHEAQGLGLHKSSLNTRCSDFESEMRRRLWCILYTWDWQMSVLLSRPLIINSTCCDFEFPDLRLEVGSQPESPSPITHVVLQCQLSLLLSKITGVMGGNISPTQAMAVQQETEKWFDSFPPVYSIANPDTRWDDTHQFLKPQRFHLKTIGYMMMLMMLMPLKQCLTKHIESSSSSIEKSLQITVVENALELLKACDELLQHLLPLNAKFHFAPFLMFDTAALLCSAIAISKTLSELGRLSGRAKVGRICHRALKRLVVCLPFSVGTLPTLPDVLEVSPPLPHLDGTNLPSSTFDNEFFGHVSLDSLPLYPLSEYTSLSDLPDFDLGELGQIWDWGSLNIDFTSELLV